MLKHFKNHHLISSSLPINNLSINGIFQIQEIINKFCSPACSSGTPTVSDRDIRNLLLDSTHRFSLNEIRTAHAVRISSSLSLDGIDYRLIKALPDELFSCLLFIKSHLFIFYFLRSMIAFYHLIPKLYSAIDLYHSHPVF